MASGISLIIFTAFVVGFVPEFLVVVVWKLGFDQLSDLLQPFFWHVVVSAQYPQLILHCEVKPGRPACVNNSVVSVVGQDDMVVWFLVHVSSFSKVDIASAFITSALGLAINP